MSREITKKGGPATREGKDVVRWNATRHGLCSTAPVVPGLESEEDWEAHREGVLWDLDPRGYLEEVLAGQIASLIWRRNRVVRFENDTASSSRGRAEQELYKLKRLEEARRRVRFADDLPALSDEAPIPIKEALSLFHRVADVLAANRTQLIDLASVPLPDTTTDASPAQPRWTAGGFREAIAALAKQTVGQPEGLLNWVAGIASLDLKDAEREAEWTGLQPDSDVIEERERAWQERVLPDEKALEKVVRYQTFLTREVDRTFAQLKALRSGRGG